MAHRRLEVTRDHRGVATVSLQPTQDGPVFDEDLLGELLELAANIEGDRSVRVLILTGQGSGFCAGGDPHWMGRLRDSPIEENVRLGLRLESMYRSLDRLPQALVGRINGDAIGAGTGLAAVCDVVIAVEDAHFGFSDTLLGLAPAVVAPYFVAKVGPGFARAAFVTSNRFDARRAREVGLVHYVAERDDLEGSVETVVTRLLHGAPGAIAVAKRLAGEVNGVRPEMVAERNAHMVAELRAAHEGVEGADALLQGRRPRWVTES